MRSKSRVLYISSFAVKSHHSVINRSLLDMLKAQNSEQIIVYASSSSDCYKESSGHNRQLHIPIGSGRLSLLMRYLISAYYNLWFLLTSRRNDELVYNYNNVFSTAVINCLNKLLKRRVTICCHGEMEYLSNESAHSAVYKKLLIRLCKLAFNRHTIPAPGLRYVVLGDVIKENLRPYLSDKLYDRFMSIDHPVGNAICPPRVAGCPIKIGTVGIMNYYKGSEIYPEVASRFKDNKNIEFHCVGQVQSDVKDLIDVGVNVTNGSSEPLAPEVFSERVQNLDFLLFLYPTDNYRLMASGAFLDALRFSRPVIALRTPYFEYLFNKFGAFGYLADNIDELCSLIAQAPTLNRNFPFSDIAHRINTQKS